MVKHPYFITFEVIRMIDKFRKLGMTQDEVINLHIAASELPDKFMKHKGQKVRITEKILYGDRYDRHFTTTSSMTMILGDSGVRFSGLRLNISSSDYTEAYEIEVSSIFKIEIEDSCHYKIYECLDFSGEEPLKRETEIAITWE